MGDKMFGWHHWFNGHELGQTPGDGEGQGGLPCCSPWGHKELDMTWWLNNAILYKRFGWPLILASVGIPGTNLPWMLKGDYNLLSSSRHPGCPCVTAVNFRESRVSDQGLLRARLGNGTSNWKGQSRFKQWEKRLHFYKGELQGHGPREGVHFEPLLQHTTSTSTKGGLIIWCVLTEILFKLQA